MKVFEKNGPYMSVLNDDNNNNKLNGARHVFNDGGGGVGGGYCNKEGNEAGF